MLIAETGAITPETRLETVAYGLLVYARATSREWPASVRDAAKGEAAALEDALDLYDSLAGGDALPALAGFGLQEAVQDIAERTADLIKAFPGCEPRGEKGEAA